MSTHNLALFFQLFNRSILRTKIVIRNARMTKRIAKKLQMAM